MVVAGAHAAGTEGFDATIKEGDEAESRFCGKAPDLAIHITALGSVTLGTSNRTTKAKLPLWKEEYLEWTWIKLYQGDLLVAFEASNGDSGRGGVCRFGLQPLTRKWCSRIHGFNVVASVGPDDSIYVGSIDFVGRIQATDGKYIWRQRGLHKKDPAFNVLGVPSVEGDTVIFDATAGAGSSPNRRLSLDRRTGVIKSIETAQIDRSNIGLQRTRGSCALLAADSGR